MASISHYQTKGGKRWHVQYRDGSGTARSKRGFVRKSDAQAWSAQNSVAIGNGEWSSHADRQRTVDDFAKTYLLRVRNAPASSERTNTLAWENHVRPKWGKVAVGGIRPSQVQAWVDESAVGASATRRNVDVLAQVLDVAVRDGVIKANPARGLKLPKKPLPRQVYLTASQLTRIAEESSHPEIVWLLGTVGLRWGN